MVYAFDEDEMLRRFYEEEEEDKWLLQNEFVDNFSFKISSSPPAHRICGFNLFTRFSVTSGYSRYDPFYIVRNNTSCRSMRFQTYAFPVNYKRGVREIQTLRHRKLRVDDPTFDNGDDVSISVLLDDPDIQIRTIGVQWLHEEEGKDDDFIQSKDEVINAHNSSDEDDDDAAHVAKVKIASHLLRSYYCAFRTEFNDGEFAWWFYAKNGLEVGLI